MRIPSISEDFPDPDTPATATKIPRGISQVILFRLLKFAPCIVILVHISIKSYDLIVALTQGGPGISTTMPALYMTQTAFHKSQVGLSAASAMMM